jgi:hypothetical protein
MGGNGGVVECRAKDEGYRCTLDRGHGGGHEAGAGAGVVVRRWPRAIPPPEDCGTYAAVLAETIRQLLEHPGSRTTADRARDLLARWDDGEPWDLHRTLTAVLDENVEVDRHGA